MKPRVTAAIVSAAIGIFLLWQAAPASQEAGWQVTDRARTCHQMLLAMP